MERDTKTQQIGEIRARFDKMTAAVFLDYKGMTVENATKLRAAFRKAGVDLLYSRSLVPSYGFGGTMQNVEATLRANAPLGRRVYASPALTWRRNDPLTPGMLPLRSYWLEGTVGYAATPWVHVELFYEGTHQNVDRAGGIVNRNRIGVQITTAKPVRIQ